MHDALTRGDVRNARITAHGIRGAAENLGAVALARVAAELEGLLEQGAARSLLLNAAQQLRTMQESITEICQAG